MEIYCCLGCLEDINGDGGSFHVYPKSFGGDFDWIGIDHDGPLEWSISNTKEKKSILLSKGDPLV